MSTSLPWTKLQDFYLRLGFLKALVAVLGSERRSVPPAAIIRRARTPLLDRLSSAPALSARTDHRMTWFPPPEKRLGPKAKHPTIADGLIVDADLPSVLSAITAPTAYKMLDWGRDAGLSGRGNQISERGIILRALSDMKAGEAFMTGDVEAWNPFILTIQEKLFFLYHLLDIDRVTAGILDAVGQSGLDEVLDIGPASRIMARSLKMVLAKAKANLRPSDIPAFRIATELAATIAAEVGLAGASAPRRGPPKPIRPAARRKLLLGGGEPRRTTKNADHQTVPRFEQLCDLGLIDKADSEKDLAARHRWRWRATDAGRRWAKARAELRLPESRFLAEGFARTALYAYVGSPVGPRCSSAGLIASYLASAYQEVRRPVGHTPLDSVALVASCRAIGDGHAIELADFHYLMLAIKQGGYLEGEVFFASGNDLDRMFVLIRDDFAERVAASLPADLRVIAPQENDPS